MTIDDDNNNDKLFIRSKVIVLFEIALIVRKK